MSRLVIIKVGDALPSIAEHKGDYDRWFAEGIGAPEVHVVDPRRGDELPSLEGVTAIAMTGSSSMVTDRAEWSERTATWLKHAHETALPMLCVCYGHQLLADAMGGEVAKNPRGREMGTIEVTLTDAAREDALFGSMGPRLRVHATHVESVVELPPGAVRLGENALDPNQMYRLGSAWAVQFHPEFDHDVISELVRKRADRLREESLSPEAMLDAIGPTEDGARILRRFGELAFGSAQKR